MKLTSTMNGSSRLVPKLKQECVLWCRYFLRPIMMSYPSTFSLRKHNTLMHAAVGFLNLVIVWRSVIDISAATMIGVVAQDIQRSGPADPSCCKSSRCRLRRNALPFLHRNLSQPREMSVSHMVERSQSKTRLRMLLRWFSHIPFVYISNVTHSLFNCVIKRQRYGLRCPILFLPYKSDWRKTQISK